MAGYPSRTPGELGVLTDRVDALEGQLRRVLSPTAEQYAQAVASLKVLVDAIPVTSTASGTRTGAGGSGASGAWVNFTQFDCLVAPGKKRMVGQVVAQAVMVDTTSGGGATLSMRLAVRYPDGSTVYSPAFQAAKNAGASAVNNVVNGSITFDRTGMTDGQAVTIYVQCAETNPAAFPANSGNLVQGSAIFVSS